MPPTAVLIRKPTRKEVDFYYKTHRSQFHAPERVHALQIVKNVHFPRQHQSATLVLERALARLRAGEEFSKVADEDSDCGGNGGDLGWFPRGVMVEEFEDVVFEMGPKEISPIFETRFGLHIVQVLEKRPAGIQPLGEVYDAIANAIYQSRLERTPK
jgi:parvulin-like peptidyl-prolyl isomerase